MNKGGQVREYPSGPDYACFFFFWGGEGCSELLAFEREFTLSVKREIFRLEVFRCMYPLELDLSKAEVISRRHFLAFSNCFSSLMGWGKKGSEMSGVYLEEILDYAFFHMLQINVNFN